MSFIYHVKPDRMFGNILYPLNALKEIDNETYDFHASKYKGRESLMEHKIPILDCLWNDVLHCSSIDLRIIYNALIKNGHKVRNMEFFKIPVGMLKDIKFVKYKFEKEAFDRDKKQYRVLTSEDIEPLTIDTHQETSDLPDKTIEWYRWCAEHNKGPRLLFRYIPHIFVKGSINTKELEVIDWSQKLDG